MKHSVSLQRIGSPSWSQSLQGDDVNIKVNPKRVEFEEIVDSSGSGQDIVAGFKNTIMHLQAQYIQEFPEQRGTVGI